MANNVIVIDGYTFVCTPCWCGRCDGWYLNPMHVFVSGRWEFGVAPEC